MRLIKSILTIILANWEVMSITEELERQVREEALLWWKEGGTIHQVDVMEAYVEKMLYHVDAAALKPYKVVVEEYRKKYPVYGEQNGVGKSPCM